MTAISPAANARARNLRNQATDGERRLWTELRKFRNTNGIHVRRQVPIGPYVVDFAIYSKRFIVELDGEFHFTSLGVEKDRKRDAWLQQQGYRILRITTAELDENLDGCINSILCELGLMQ